MSRCFVVRSATGIGLLLAGLLLAAWPARAVPPDRRVELSPGGDRFEKGLPGKWIAISMEPKVVEARAFETAEVHLQAHEPGDTLVLLVNHAIHYVMFWRVRVGQGGSAPGEPPAGAVHKACGCDPAARPLRCTVSSAACIQALRGFLDRSDLTAEQLRLKYTVPGLQALLKDLSARLVKAGFADIELAFSGANLRIRGRVADEAAWRRLLVTLYRGMVGKLLLEDRVQIGPAGD